MTKRGRALAIGILVVAVVIAAAVGIWLAVGGGPASEAPATPSPSPIASTDSRELAQRALEEHLEECTAPLTDGVVPDGCGIRIPWGTEFAAVTTVTFRIERMPQLDTADGTFVAGGGELVATVSGTGQDGTPRTETYRTESWAVRGDVTVEGDAVDLTVW